MCNKHHEGCALLESEVGAGFHCSMCNKLRPEGKGGGATCRKRAGLRARLLDSLGKTNCHCTLGQAVVAGLLRKLHRVGNSCCPILLDSLSHTTLSFLPRVT